MSEILSHRFWTEMGTKVVAGALQSAWDILKVVILFLVARLILNKVLDGVSGSLIRREEGVSEGKAARIKTLGSLLKSIGNYVLIFIAGVMLLRAFKVDPVPILTTAGVAGLAVGFGAQRLVRDVITGFFILLENQFSVGDYVTIGAISGVVEEMGMRITRIREDSGRLVIISNGDIVQVINHSRGPAQITIDFGVPADADLNRIRSLIEDKIALKPLDLEGGLIEPPRLSGIVAMDGARVTLRVTAKVPSAARIAAEMALRREIREELRHQEIGIM